MQQFRKATMILACHASVDIKHGSAFGIATVSKQKVMPHHTSAATLQGFMLHSWNSWGMNSHWYPGIPTHACCIPVLWEVRFNFEKTRFPSNHLSGIIFWWWTAGVQEKHALLCQQPSMQMNWPCHMFIHFFSHLRSGKQSWSKPKFGRKLLNSWIWDASYLTYLLILLLIGSLPFQGALPWVL